MSDWWIMWRRRGSGELDLVFEVVAATDRAPHLDHLGPVRAGDALDRDHRGVALHLEYRRILRGRRARVERLHRADHVHAALRAQRVVQRGALEVAPAERAETPLRQIGQVMHDHDAVLLDRTMDRENARSFSEA